MQWGRNTTAIAVGLLVAGGIVVTTVAVNGPRSDQHVATLSGEAPAPPAGSSSLSSGDIDAVDIKKSLEAEEDHSSAESASIAADPDQLSKIVADKEAARAQQEQDAKNAPPVQYGTWPTGIFEDPEAPAPAMQFSGTNRWVGKARHQSVVVHAGLAGDDPEVGRVMIIWERSAPEGWAGSRGATIDLTGAGRLRIVSADNDALTVTIQDSHGDEHVLDVLTARWLP